ncbi:methylated-DNA--[protein]-cysteine S-methyltransferase [Roseomonas xinghualingensis]|uniref:methylated-DNA--[protein]-cysteine S-methyltransferase n=1 Tax=Roseomonas xinghualingensis TaxID=2986475 RepID=UPI0021F1E204|nr:methylated-DNA--[protein]-cysteine S-methyltransferase [Roseomonas sp. SXEYE001]MCV4206052.1 methylated-DNA--[protein]-cysteine S-methyltransferase [Roseomonas sp. SXEYE001]
MPQTFLHTPLGVLTLSEEDGAIVALDWGQGCDREETPLLRRAADQLQDYMDGLRTEFDLPLNPFGSPFRQRVWQALRDIPYGETRSYADLAATLGTASRAIGGANGANPIPIIIPCHRVIGAQGAIGGYSGEGGLATKRWLLALERRTRGADPARPDLLDASPSLPQTRRAPRAPEAI